MKNMTNEFKNFIKFLHLRTHFKENSFKNQIFNPISIYLAQFQAIYPKISKTLYAIINVYTIPFE